MSGPRVELVALTLLRGMGPVGFKACLERFGSLEKVYAASPGQWRSHPKLAKIDPAGLYDGSLPAAARALIEDCRRKGIGMIARSDPDYPSALSEIFDPPMLLYVKGERCWRDAVSVSIVGSRRASPYGLRMAKTIAEGLAASGVVVTSGMALGIDTKAHEGALAGQGRTIAVLGGGFERLYPRENARLAEKIASNGALISEYPPATEPQSRFFPIRNRIVSGLSKAVVVIEAREKSGAFITVDTALDQGREVFALPGNVDSPMSGGTNELLREGAKIVSSYRDILAELGLPAAEVRPGGSHTAPEGLTGPEAAVLAALDADVPAQIDAVASKSGVGVRRAMTALSALCLRKLVREMPGKYYVRS